MAQIRAAAARVPNARNSAEPGGNSVAGNNSKRRQQHQLWSNHMILFYVFFFCAMSLMIALALSLEVHYNNNSSSNIHGQESSNIHNAAIQADTTPSAFSMTGQQKSHTDCNWRLEPLQGVCDATKSTPESQQHNASAAACEAACCASPTCIVFQYRKLEGCLFASSDTRLGAEKDGVSAWCEPRAPAPWQGQRIQDKATKKPIPGACSSSTTNSTSAGSPSWNPNELRGQCFGLGPRRKIKDNTARACQESCCKEETCVIWQWQAGSGCYYNKRGFNCQDPLEGSFEPFVGKRKAQASRSYHPPAYSKDYADMAESLPSLSSAT